MSKPQRNQRWWLWVPLLAGAGWLAIFGDKAPTNAVTVSTQTPRLNPPLRGPISRVTPDDGPPQTSTRQGNSASRSVIDEPSQVNRALEPVIPREQLILKTAAKSNVDRDLFASGGWQPPVPVITPPPLPAPTAPPLPFTFLGKKLESGTWEVFLVRGEQSFVVRTGTLIENIYRVEAITPPTLTMTYLPLSEKQTLAVGDSQ